MKAHWAWLLSVCTVMWLAAGGSLHANTTPTTPKSENVRKLTYRELAGIIDQKIAERCHKEGVKLSPLTDEAEFLRRVALDLTGRIPRVSEAREYLANTQPNKREQLIERLLESPHYVTHMVDTWQGLMVPQAAANIQLQFVGNTFRTWLVPRVRDNTPYDKMVRELLTAAQSNQPVGGRLVLPSQTGVLAFYQANENKAENLASSVARIFLGVKIECAQCHNHPFATWSRQQFWEMAAFFASFERRVPRFVRPGQQPPVVNLKDWQIKMGDTAKVVEARFLDGRAPKWEDGMDVRAIFADWVISPENKYFARTAVNRLWAHFLGYGLIDPVDDEPTEDNPCSHPELLEELTRQFIAHDFDVKYLIRAITNSRTYQTSSVLTDPGQKEPRLFARMTVRGLTAEQLYESLARATGFKEGGAVQGRVFFNPASLRADILNRFASQERRAEAQTSILQALTLMNGRLISDATSLDKSRTLGAVVDSPFLSTEEKLETLFLATLTRRPRSEELARLSAYVNDGGPRRDSRAALADVFWALLNSPEFFLNH